MVVAPWLLYKEKHLKKLVLHCIGLNLHFDGLNYPLLNDLIGGCSWNEENNNFICPVSDSELIKIVNEHKKELSPVDDLTLEKPEKMEAAKKENNSFDVAQEKTEKRGRPLKNGVIQRKKEVYSLFREKNADSFLLLDNNTDIIQSDDVYIEKLLETVEIIKNNFFSENPDLIKKHPSIWFRRLCNEIKKATPRMDYNNNPSIIGRVWDIYADLCMYVGINRTIENFQIFTGLSWSTIDKLKKASSPDYIEIAKKIYDSCKADLVGGLGTSFGSSPNQMFIAKSIYGIVENTVITHVSAADNTKNIDDIPLFIEKKNENS